jgi:peptidoglycan hydrolase CwlO-like protein
MKFILYNDDSSALELAKTYNKAKKERLKLVYKLKHDYERELNILRNKIASKQNIIAKLEAEARYDRENADGMSYNEILLSIN